SPDRSHPFSLPLLPHSSFFILLHSNFHESCIILYLGPGPDCIVGRYNSWGTRPKTPGTPARRPKRRAPSASCSSSPATNPPPTSPKPFAQPACCSTSPASPPSPKPSAAALARPST